jgi:hypothetical protein
MPRFTRWSLLLPAGLLLGCGGGSANPSASARAVVAVASTPSPTPAPTATPAGGPAPAELAGTWTQMTNQVSKAEIAFDGRDYRVNGAFGNISVIADEIDFFAGPCDGLGRYQWSLQSGVLHFKSLNDDPCGRGVHLAGQSYTKNPG